MSATTIIKKAISRVSSFSKLVFTTPLCVLFMAQNCSSSGADHETRININNGAGHPSGEDAPLLRVERGDRPIRTIPELEEAIQQNLDNPPSNLTIDEGPAQEKLGNIAKYVGYGIGKYKKTVEKELREAGEIQPTQTENTQVVLQKAYDAAIKGPLPEIIGQLLIQQEALKQQNKSLNALLSDVRPVLGIARENEMYIATLKKALWITTPFAILFVGSVIAGGAWAWYTWGR